MLTGGNLTIKPDSACWRASRLKALIPVEGNAKFQEYAGLRRFRHIDRYNGSVNFQAAFAEPYFRLCYCGKWSDMVHNSAVNYDGLCKADGENGVHRTAPSWYSALRQIMH